MSLDPWHMINYDNIDYYPILSTICVIGWFLMIGAKYLRPQAIVLSLPIVNDIVVND